MFVAFYIPVSDCLFASLRFSGYVFYKSATKYVYVIDNFSAIEISEFLTKLAGQNPIGL